MTDHPGHSLRQAIATEKPLQMVGVIHALAARMAEQVGFRALYLSGAGLANTQYALPDLGLTSLNDVLAAVSQIKEGSSLPLLVDVDTGWGNSLTIQRTFKLLSRAGAAGAHIEDQQDFKRCGHRAGKRLVSCQQMVGRIKAALDGREQESFMVMARTDALAQEGLAATLQRVQAYQAAGAEAIFLEAVTSLEHYQQFCQTLTIPVLANITEFGKTPLFTTQQLAQVGVQMVLYPLSAFRAMNAAALAVYNAIRQQGTQQSVVPLMQTRAELYQILHYEKFEQQLDEYWQSMGEENGSV